MNFRLVANLMGKALLFLGLAMIFPLLWAIYDQSPDVMAFVYSIAITVFSGLVIVLAVPQDGEVRFREGFAIVSFGWLLVSLYGTLPYLFSGSCAGFSDAFFETVSGFTTTGASIFSDVESLSRGILFWRSLTHWLGGMGIIVFLVALLSRLGVGANRIFRAEVPGPVKFKIMPRISDTAKVLWLTYLGLTIVETFLLWVLGMPFFDSLCHSFGTIATAGFSVKNASIGYYEQSSIQWVIIVFMFLSGANFALYYQALRGRSLKVFWHHEEFRFYFAIVLFVTLLTALNTSTLFNSLEELLRTSAFQVVSIITTTGYVTADFSIWPYMSQAMLLALMFVGGCSGSTSGSIKVARILILLKQSILEIKKLLHPRSVSSLKIGGRNVSKEIVGNVMQFFFLYMAIIAVSGIVMTAMGLDLKNAFTSVIATFGNIGPGLGMVGPEGSYAMIPGQGKLFLGFLMLLGRLEIYTVFVLFTPDFWK